MSAREDSEQILRELSILLSKARAYEGSVSEIIVDKKQILGLLEEWNKVSDQMLEEYELTKSKRDEAKRKHKRKAEAVVDDAKRKAEDVYAASILYTDHAIDEIRRLVTKSNEELDQIHHKMQESMEEEMKQLRENQLELQGQLKDMVDTKKYMRLIEEENKRLAKERERVKELEESGQFRPTSYTAEALPEIRVNPDYFERSQEAEAEEADKPVEYQIRTNFPEEDQLPVEGIDAKAKEQDEKSREDQRSPEREHIRTASADQEKRVRRVLEIFQKRSES